MKNNIVQWANHYQDILFKYYLKFKLLLESYGEEYLSYNEFVNFCYRNTKKNIINQPGWFAKELYATIGNNT